MPKTVHPSAQGSIPRIAGLFRKMLKQLFRKLSPYWRTLIALMRSGEKRSKSR